MNITTELAEAYFSIKNLIKDITSLRLDPTAEEIVYDKSNFILNSDFVLEVNGKANTENFYKLLKREKIGYKQVTVKENEEITKTILFFPYYKNQEKKYFKEFTKLFFLKYLQRIIQEERKNMNLHFICYNEIIYADFTHINQEQKSKNYLNKIVDIFYNCLTLDYVKSKIISEKNTNIMVKTDLTKYNYIYTQLNKKILETYKGLL